MESNITLHQLQATTAGSIIGFLGAMAILGNLKDVFISKHFNVKLISFGLAGIVIGGAIGYYITKDTPQKN